VPGLRTTAEGRIMIGDEDEDLVNAKRRDGLFGKSNPDARLFRFGR
jgi:hypothetical protein